MITVVTLQSLSINYSIKMTRNGLNSYLTLDMRTGSLDPAFGIWFGGISQSSVFRTQPICWQAKAADSTVQPKLQTVPHWLSILTWE